MSEEGEANLRRELGDEAFSTAYAQGLRLPDAEALELARAEIGSIASELEPPEGDLH